MASESEEHLVDAVLCFDANLPKMQDCSDRWEKNLLVLCKHRFNFNARIKYYNTRQFQNYRNTKKGWPDSKILLHVLDHVKSCIRKGSLSPNTVVTILTKDIDFLIDAEMELSWNVRGNDLVFSNNFVTCGDIVIFVQLLNCKNYGTSGPDVLKCAIYRMNEFFKKRQGV